MGRDTLQGAGGWFLGCQTFVPEQLTACCCQVSARGDVGLRQGGVEPLQELTCCAHNSATHSCPMLASGRARTDLVPSWPWHINLVPKCISTSTGVAPVFDLAKHILRICDACKSYCNMKYTHSSPHRRQTLSESVWRRSVLG